MNVFKLVCLCLLAFIFFTVSYSNLLEESLYFEGKVKLCLLCTRLTLELAYLLVIPGKLRSIIHLDQK